MKKIGFVAFLLFACLMMGASGNWVYAFDAPGLPQWETSCADRDECDGNCSGGNTGGTCKEDIETGGCACIASQLLLPPGDEEPRGGYCSGP